MVTKKKSFLTTNSSVITAIISLTILESMALCIAHVDGVTLSAVVGGIIFLVTRKKYKL